MRILFVGDIVGSPGRDVLKKMMPEITQTISPDFVVANGENAAAGFGLTKKAAGELFDAGIHVLTSGNHIFAKKEVFELFETENRLLRPANYPEGTPGKGCDVFATSSGKKIGILNLVGRVFMNPTDCPFQVAARALDRLKEQTPVILVDFHAEATAEKQAMGWFLDGKVSAVVGTHTHVPTADERILSSGTGYITDVGMTGSYKSCIGLKVSVALERFLLARHIPFEVAEGDESVSAVCMEVDDVSGKSTGIRRIFLNSNHH